MQSKKTLKHYEAILNEIEDGVGETDLKGNLTYINSAGCRIWGYEPQELIGSNCRSYADENEAEFLRKIYNRVYEKGYHRD